MSIKPPSDVSDNSRITETLQQDAVKVSARLRQRAQAGAEQDLTDCKGPAEEVTDTVTLGLAATIRAEPNPELFMAERRAKVEEIKKLVQSGKYARSSQDIARAFLDELGMEIATAPKID